MYIDSITFIIRLSISREDRIFSRKDILYCPESLTPFLMPVYLSVFPRRHSVNAMKSFIKPGRAAVARLSCDFVHSNIRFRQKLRCSLHAHMHEHIREISTCLL